jgi:intracellular sulfur oxidation DsrE/DsrF family protein
MKKFILLSAAALLMFCNLFAQKAPYNVVFDVTSKDTVVHQMVMRWVKEILNADPKANIEVVFYGKSLDMITRDRSVVADTLIKYAANKNVAFRVCEVALKNNGIEKSQLLQGVGTVPDGIYEIISKQHEGWGYIKASR